MCKSYLQVENGMDNLETQVDQNNATIGNLTSDVESQDQEVDDLQHGFIQLESAVNKNSATIGTLTSNVESQGQEVDNLDILFGNLASDVESQGQEVDDLKQDLYFLKNRLFPEDDIFSVNGTTYSYSTTSLNYEDARESCKRNGGKLIEPQTLESYNEVEAALKLLGAADW